MSAPIFYELERYEMNAVNNCVGKAYIFHHTEFDDRGPPWNKQTVHQPRKGTKKDVENLVDLFKMMKLDIVDCPDFTEEKFRKELDAVDKNITDDHKCLVVAILTHGSEHHIALKDEDFELARVFEKFDCRALLNKPKIFFVQACRGNNYNVGLEKSSVDATQELISNEGIGTTTPQGADFLVCYSTTKGFTSFRRPAYGSWFIEQIYSVFKSYFSGSSVDMDLVSLMAKVNKAVAEKTESGEMTKGDKKTKVQLKQMPTFVSNLRAQVVFRISSSLAQGDTFND